MNIIEIVKDVLMPLLTFGLGFLIAKRGLTDPHRHAIYAKQLEASAELLAASHLIGPGAYVSDDVSPAYLKFVSAFERWRIYLPSDANDALTDFYLEAAKLAGLADVAEGESRYLPVMASRRNLERALRRVIGVDPLSEETLRIVSSLQK